MNQTFAYDPERNPPAPVFPLKIGRPETEPTLVLAALVDTGADTTIIPESIARRLRLPATQKVQIRGVGGSLRQAFTHVVAVDIASIREMLEVVALGDEALIGRDLLNRWTIVLRGPQHLMEIMK